MDNQTSTSNEETRGITAAQVAELKRANPDDELHLLELEVGDELFQVVCRTPGTEYDDWRNKRDLDEADVQSKRLADRNFVNACRVYPAGPDWIAMCNRKRAIATTFAGELAQLAGVSKNARRKKL